MLEWYKERKRKRVVKEIIEEYERVFNSDTTIEGTLLTKDEAKQMKAYKLKEIAFKFDFVGGAKVCIEEDWPIPNLSNCFPSHKYTYEYYTGIARKLLELNWHKVHQHFQIKPLFFDYNQVPQYNDPKVCWKYHEDSFEFEHIKQRYLECLKELSSDG